MTDQDREKLNEIHECLLGTLEKEGLISRTDKRFIALETEIKRWKFLATSIGIPALLLGVGELLHNIIGKGA